MTTTFKEIDMSFIGKTIKYVVVYPTVAVVTLGIVLMVWGPEITDVPIAETKVVDKVETKVVDKVEAVCNAPCAKITNVLKTEIAYDYKNLQHKADNTCVGVLSLVRDALFNEVQVKDGMAFVKIVEPTAELIEFRNKMTALQNSYILKYEYSKQFNTHFEVAKVLIKQRTDEQGAEYLANELKNCVV